MAIQIHWGPVDESGVAELLIGETPVTFDPTTGVVSVQKPKPSIGRSPPPPPPPPQDPMRRPIVTFSYDPNPGGTLAPGEIAGCIVTLDMRDQMVIEQRHIENVVKAVRALRWNPEDGALTATVADMQVAHALEVQLKTSMAGAAPRVLAQVLTSGPYTKLGSI